MKKINIEAQPLMTDLGIDPENIDQRLRLVGLEPQDIKLIALLKPLMQREVDALVARFFDFLSTRADAEKLLADKQLTDMACALKKEHLLAMVEGEYDRRYVGQRLRLAQVYSTAELPQRVFMAAIEHLLAGIGELIIEEQEKSKAFQTLKAFRKVASFDIALIVDTLIHEREKVIRSQEQAIRQLSTPVLQLRERMLLLPLVGSIGRNRAKQLTNDLLEAIRRTRAQVAVIDMTGTAFVDTTVANHLRGTIKASRIMGCRVIMSGISAEISKELVDHHIILEGIEVVGDLRRGIEAAERIIQPIQTAPETSPETEVPNSPH